jgi:1-acyl-sn-glycerol-3-phosphate acyltransferase
VQHAVGRATALLWVPLVVALMRFGFRWRVDGMAEARRVYRGLQGGDGTARTPVLVCANHLTLVDSAVVAWALGSPWLYLRRFAALPWNVPERRNFASSWLQRVLVYLMKCVPIERGSDRKAVGAVLDRLAYLLARGEAVLIFPEGGRSRTGRIDGQTQTYGVGRLAAEVPGCKVLCVYLRGASQETWSALPRRGERFAVQVEVLEPGDRTRGLRGSVELSRRILARLAAMEGAYFDGR